MCLSIPLSHTVLQYTLVVVLDDPHERESHERPSGSPGVCHVCIVCAILRLQFYFHKTSYINISIDKLRIIILSTLITKSIESMSWL